MSSSSLPPEPTLSIAFSNVAHLFTHALTILYATAVLYLPQEFGLPYGEMLGLSSVGLILFGVGSLPAGWIGDRWSQVGMIVIFFLGAGASAIVIGTAKSVPALFIGLSLVGLFASIYHPIGIAWLVACARKQGMTLGINAVFGGLGSAIAPVFVGIMVDHVSWRAAFVIPGVLAFATGLGLLFAWRRGWVADLRADRAPAPPPDPSTYRRVFFVLIVTMACNGLVYTGMLHTIPKVFESGLGDVLSSTTNFFVMLGIETGNYTDLGLLVGAVIGLSSLCSIFGGWLADRYSVKRIYLIFWTLTIPPLLFVTSTSGMTLLAVVLLAMSFNVTFVAAENILVARYTPFKWRSLAYGARFVLALGVGGLTVLLAGDLYDQDGNFTVIYLLLAGGALLASLGALLLPPTPTHASPVIP